LKPATLAALLAVMPAAMPAAMPLAAPLVAQSAPPPAMKEGAQPAAAAPADLALLPMRNAREFICPDGQLVTIEHDEPAGILRGIRAGETFTLLAQVGRTPPRFVMGSDSVDLAPDSIILRRGREARQTCPEKPATPTAGTVWGTLTKLDRMALPPGTRAKVLLVDTARADAPAVELGSTQITSTGNQVPLWFLVRHDPARLAAPARPTLQARIEDAKGKLLYITDTANPIPNDSPAPSPVELRLVPVPRQ
jgi:putative lipoprotein